MREKEAHGASFLLPFEFTGIADVAVHLAKRQTNSSPGRLAMTANPCNLAET